MRITNAFTWMRATQPGDTSPRTRAFINYATDLEEHDPTILPDSRESHLS